ncbi:integrator complex subunit 15 [Phlebotomus argentipes]|uniref:integrator complex subunit 15 n=1 Tax=Phlebotomus argentipes TaxID=94469 RepID=UPI002892D710|nr:integrator complex subunit 15 [Phlebotomus argentipes]
MSLGGSSKREYHKMDYSLRVRDTLQRIETMINTRTKQEHMMELIAEIFCEKPRDLDVRKSQNQLLPATLSLIQELQLVVVLCEYFQTPGSEATRNAMFLSLFASPTSITRINVLVKLVSTSVSALIAPLLCAAGTWMQQLGCTSQSSLDLAQNLVTDFIVFAQKASEQLKYLPQVAPRFTANIITAVAELYLNDMHDSAAVPPKILLETFTEWVSSSPELCLSSQKPLVLPSGAIAMPVLTPLAGLIRWCVMAPLLDPGKSYSRLHLAIIQSMQQTPSHTGPPTVINAQHLCLIVATLEGKCVQIRRPENKSKDTEERFQLCLERFAQAVQVALSSHCVYGSIPQLLCRLEALPPCTLMQMVIKSNRHT